MLERPISELMRLGMTEYEARAYTALVGIGEGTARQVHDASGIPRPRIYDILTSLESRGFVEVWQGKPMHYRAVPPDQLMRLLREGMEGSIKSASDALSELSLKVRQRTFPVWHVRGELSIQDQVRSFLSDVQEDLIIVCTLTSTFRPLVKALSSIAERADVLCIVPEDASTFRSALGPAKVIEPPLGSDTLAETYMKVFTGKIGSSDEKYRAIMLLIVDRTRSLLIYEMNNERTALVFEIPLIVALQYSAIVRLSEDVGKRQ